MSRNVKSNAKPNRMARLPNADPKNIADAIRIFSTTTTTTFEMAEQLTNGNGEVPAANVDGDVEMKEEAPLEAPLDNIQQTDPTDPNPPPQAPSEAPVVASDPEPTAASAPVPPPAPTPAPASIPEHLSTIAPAIATPSAGSSTRPNSMPPARPDKPVAHGGPTRQYLNTNITPHLLEGMKYLAAHEPTKPLEWLGDFLKERSKEVEG